MSKSAGSSDAVALGGGGLTANGIGGGGGGETTSLTAIATARHKSLAGDPALGSLRMSGSANTTRPCSSTVTVWSYPVLLRVCAMLTRTPSASRTSHSTHSRSVDVLYGGRSDQAM